jgi:hypothetical protein
MKPMVEAVAEAIEKATKMRSYGLYDYSTYPGTKPPHVVRDEQTEIVVARFEERREAVECWRKLRREFIACEAIRAMNDWMSADLTRQLAQRTVLGFYGAIR